MRGAELRDRWQRCRTSSHLLLLAHVAFTTLGWSMSTSANVVGEFIAISRSLPTT